MAQRRVAFYIDGFNLYHAIDGFKRPHLKWVSYWKLAERTIDNNELIVETKLFTAIALHHPGPAQRHQEFLKAMRLEGVSPILGAFKKTRKKCPHCSRKIESHEEKESDVNMAIHLLSDCAQGAIDVAYVVTTDSDLAPAIRMVQAQCPLIDIVTVATPGRRHSKEILQECARKTTWSLADLEECLMPEIITDGRVTAWRPVEYAPPDP